MTPERTTVILIRHGERLATSSNPPLSAAGQQRARLLLHVLSQANVSAIYTSDALRTKQTAEPLATKLSLSPLEVLTPQDIKHDILTNHAGKTVLVVGHTNTVPEVIELLGDSKPEIEDHEFDNMFLATVLGDGVRVTRLKYGKQS